MRTRAVFVVACALSLLIACVAPARESAPAQPAPPPAGAAAPAPAAQAPAAPPSLRKVRMAYGFVAPVVLPMWTALDQGIYRKYGLEVETTLMQTSAQIAPAMAAGELDVALTAGAGVVDLTLAGGDQVLIESDNNYLRFWLQGRPGLTRVEDLRGKSVAITRLGSGIHLATQIALQKAGLEAGRDVQLIQAGTTDAAFTALASGNVDAAMYGPAQFFQGRRLGYPLLADMRDYQIPYMQGSLATTRAILAAQYDLVRDFVKAHLEAVGLAKRDAALAKRLLRQHLQLDDEEAVEFNYQDWLEELADPPYPPVAAVQTVLNQRAEEIPAARTANPHDFIDDRILRELEASGFLRQALGPPIQR
jgi:NitT/TauT family transport system substrate-binding protein